MNENYIEKILGAKAGEIAKISPSHVLITNGNSHKVTEIAKGVKKPEKLIVMYDHNVPTGTPEESRIFQEIYKFAEKFNATFEQSKGVGLQYMYDEIVKEGEIVISASRQGAIFGAKGALGIEVSPTEIARILESDEYQTIVPETIKVKVKNKLNEKVSIMDAVMKLLAEDGMKGKSIEFYTQGMDERTREIMCHMATSSGAYTAFAFEKVIEEANYTLDLSEAEPMVQMPCESVEKQIYAEYKAAKEIDFSNFNAGQISDINGGTIEALRYVRDLVKGKKIKLGFRLSVSPATSTDFLKALNEGIITDIIDFGAQINGAGERSIVKQGAGAMGPGEKLVTTGYYTFKGCMGVDSSEVYMASIDTVIKAALGE